MIVTISVTVPSIYLTMQYYQGSQYEKNPENYLPADTQFVSRVSSDYGVYYIYVENNTVGIITSISVFAIPQLFNYQGIPSNITDNTTLQYYEEYREISIFKLDGINASGLLRSFVEEEPAISLFVNATNLYASMSDLTFYIASPQNTISVIGSVPLIEDSIDAYMNHSALHSQRNVIFDYSSNISLFYFSPPSLNVNHVSLNVSYNSTEIYIGFNNLNSTTLLSLSTIAVKYGLHVYLHENSIELVTGKGIQDIFRFLSSNDGISTMIGGLNI
ncbi:hypothetical protein IX51_06160 [uncultured archaeon]|nr:hypothetical protein IX51_06160 [uncultured archaeon]